MVDQDRPDDQQKNGQPSEPERRDDTVDGMPQDETARMAESETSGASEPVQTSPLPRPSVPGAEFESDEPKTNVDVEARKKQTYWRLVRRQYSKNRPAVFGLYVILLLAVVAIFSGILANNKPIICQHEGEWYLPVFSGEKSLDNQDWRSLDYDFVIWPPARYQADEIDLDNSFVAPFDMDGHYHVLGTDQLGRDLLAGLIHGASISLQIGLVAMGIASLIGIILGALAGFYGGWVDMAISRIIEIFLNFPTFFLIITLVAFLADENPEALIFLIMVVIGLTGWMGIARLTRGEVLRVRRMEYVTAANALGFSGGRVIFRHVLPNSLAPVLVAIAFGIASAILTEASLSFLGFGVPPTIVTWGSMLSEARANSYAWWLAVFPGLMIFITVLCYNLVGDGLRDATDPRLKI